jgi:hypothetical protein
LPAKSTYKEIVVSLAPVLNLYFPLLAPIIKLLQFIDTFHHLIHLYKCLAYNKAYGLIPVCFREIGYYIYPIYLLALSKIIFQTYIKFLDIAQEFGDMPYCMQDICIDVSNDEMYQYIAIV